MTENLPNNGTKYLLIFDDSCEEIPNFKPFCRNCHCCVTQGPEYTIHQTNFFSSKQIRKRYRVAKYTHSFVQVTDERLTNQNIKS